uniref:sensor histidine kinase n=1 Tax=Nonomuraea pusilla TaxID=46177 RepID=UPI0006E29479|nr:sensor histidine kinase [Nonomuraea pusilla]
MLGRLRAWAARHIVARDALAVAPLVPLCLVHALFAADLGVSPDRTGGPWGMLALTAALLAPLPWRRRSPLAVFAVTASVSFLQWLWTATLLPADLAVLIALYAVAAGCATRWALAAGAVAELGIALVVLRPGESAFVLAKEWAAFSVFVVAVWIAGRYVRTHRRYAESLRARAEQAERERDQRAVIAAAAERTRIARELHDVVAHNMSAIVIHADGARLAFDSDPEEARRSLQTISTTGRRGLTEMRRLVGVLRDGAPTGEPHSPQPDLTRLEELVEQARASGLPTAFTLSGTPSDLSEGEQLVIYRIVQEALTNALKHGGPGTRATVAIAFGADGVTVDVADDGRGRPALETEGGHGLVGMRERAALYGGTVEAGPGEDGGYRVLARIPAGGP